MKINEPSRIGNVNPYRKNMSVAPTSSDVKKRTDEVQISSEAKELLNVQNSKKLEELKQAVSTGTYHVEAGKIAEKLWPFLK
ncbi:flagellar biosynthesis anti-sigma factor FlgM [Paenibacillus sp. YN15]|uniref:flagellar biosynthesis anti-sigma factor FlgM n=1 Tax=Paenibacillus sp. YN15 TaxID=1742774 RepID=UPI000DCAFC1E|nr:flagellar biosynthesis anti-sigma factor FlgM [Paenibacillus sp. YN15]RAV03110.1 flagellar biosynthesis anti-sigma factor FlgM [Paenibacillus sp. YN15]